MPDLDAALGRLKAHEGVERVILLGRDGLIVRRLGDVPDDDEAVAARFPGIVAAAAALGAAAGNGDFATAVIEYEEGVAIAASVSDELLLALLLRPGVGFASLLRELRQARHRIVQLL